MTDGGAAPTDRALRLLDAALATLPQASRREGQREMVRAVDRALRTREHLLEQTGDSGGGARPAPGVGVVRAAAADHPARLLPRPEPAGCGGVLAGDASPGEVRA